MPPSICGRIALIARRPSRAWLSGRKAEAVRAAAASSRPACVTSHAMSCASSASSSNLVTNSIWRPGGEPEQVSNLVEGEFAVLKQSKCDFISLLLSQKTRRFAGFDHSEIACLLPDAETLSERVRPGAAESLFVIGIFGRIERAFSDWWLLQGALKKDRAVDGGAGFRRHGEVTGCLLRPDGIELVEQ